MFKKMDAWMRQNHNSVWVSVFAAVLMGIPIMLAQIVHNHEFQSIMFWVTVGLIVLCYVFVFWAGWATARADYPLGTSTKPVNKEGHRD